MLGLIGIVWTSDNVSRDAAGGAKVQKQLSAEIHALGAVAAIENDRLKTKEVTLQAKNVIEQEFEPIAPVDRLLMPRLDQLGKKSIERN